MSSNISRKKLKGARLQRIPTERLYRFPSALKDLNQEGTMNRVQGNRRGMFHLCSLDYRRGFVRDQ